MTEPVGDDVDSEVTPAGEPPESPGSGPDEVDIDEVDIDEVDIDEAGASEPVELRPRGPVMTVLNGYRVAADALAGWLGVISAILVFVTVAVTLANVVLRRVGAEIGRSITSNALIETQWYLFTVIFVTGFAYILREGINVRVDFWFGNRSARTRAWIDLVGHLVGLIPFALIGLRYSWTSVRLSWELDEQSPDPGGLPRAPIKTVLMIAFAFILIQGIAELIKVISQLRGHELRDDPDEPTLAGGQHTEAEDFDLDVARPMVGATAASDDAGGGDDG